MTTQPTLERKRHLILCAGNTHAFVSDEATLCLCGKETKAPTQPKGRRCCASCDLGSPCANEGCLCHSSPASEKVEVVEHWKDGKLVKVSPASGAVDPREISGVNKDQLLGVGIQQRKSEDERQAENLRNTASGAGKEHTDGICQACRPNPQEESWEEKFDKMWPRFGPGIRCPIEKCQDTECGREAMKNLIRSLLQDLEARKEKEMDEIYRLTLESKKVIYQEGYEAGLGARDEAIAEGMKLGAQEKVEEVRKGLTLLTDEHKFRSDPRGTWPHEYLEGMHREDSCRGCRLFDSLNKPE
jgi:hypothetical protein